MELDNLSQPWSMARPQNTRLPISPDHPFYYKHFPANWDFKYITVKAGKKEKQIPVFLPSVDMERVVPGVNGVHQIQGELGDPSSRLGKLRQAGHVVLDPNEHDYMRVYPAKYGGRKHSPKWESFRVLAGQVVKSFDKVAFDLWKIKLMIDGYIQLPHDHFMELEIIQARKHPDRYISQQHLPEVKTKLEELYKRIADMETARQGILEKGLQYYEELINGQ
tara:strand:- start:391 stop:1053 length:663 start_codon:yes stop_codon:yes gene_type:complete